MDQAQDYVIAAHHYSEVQLVLSDMENAYECAWQVLDAFILM